MRRIIATFENTEDLTAAKNDLRDADLEPQEPDIDNPFFDPTAKMPEERGLIWGGLLGGLIGAALLFAMSQNVIPIPRISPIMTAGEYMLITLGFGLGAASGGFLGGVIGTSRPSPERTGPQLVVVVPDHRTDDATTILRESGSQTVKDAVTHHEHPLRRQAADTSTSGDTE